MSRHQAKQSIYSIFENALKVFGLTVGVFVAAAVSSGTALIIGSSVGGAYLLAKVAEKLAQQKYAKTNDVAQETQDKSQQKTVNKAKKLDNKNKKEVKATKSLIQKPNDLMLLSFNEFIKEAQLGPMETVTASASIKVPSKLKLTTAAAA